MTIWPSPATEPAPTLLDKLTVVVRPEFTAALIRVDHYRDPERWDQPPPRPLPRHNAPASRTAHVRGLPH